MLANAFLLAIDAISRNAVRSLLTILGIVIGVAAVITLVTIGNGATESVKEQIENMGTNVLTIMPGRGFGPRGGTAEPFDPEDANALLEQIPSLNAVSPTASQGVVVIYGNENWSTTITGIQAEYLEIGDWQIASGTSFTEGQLRAGQAVCIIGETVRNELFGGLDPVGERIRIERLSCQVVGLLEAKGQSTFGQDQDNLVLTPLRTFQRRISGTTDVASITVSVQDATMIDRAKRDIEYLMRERRQISLGEDDDFMVRDTRELMQMLTGTTQVMTSLLGAVAAVSLLVGGIGIMNIMLVSVTERTREIGTRLAIGALEKDVLLQFLVEAMVLGCLGGAIGMALALGLSFALAQLMQVPLVLDIRVFAAAFLFSATLGVVFGFFPARRAARLNPIDALRHE